MRASCAVVALLSMCACGGTSSRSLTSPSPDTRATPDVAFVAAPAASLPVVLDGRSRTLARPLALVGAATVPAVPTLQVPVVSGMDVTIRWTPASAGDPATSFVLYYSAPGGQGGSVETTETSITATAPMAGDFSVYVCGKNAAGLGACSAPQAFRIVGGSPTAGSVPEAPTLQVPVVSGMVVTITWSPASTGAPATSFILNYSLPGGATGSAETPETSLSATVPVTGEISIYVCGKNAAGVGGCSGTQVFRIAGSVPTARPNPVTNLRISVSGTTVTLAWDAPIGVTPDVTYMIQIPPIGVFDAGPALTASGTMEPGRYTASVYAKNAAGNGDASNQVEFTVGGGCELPGVPRQLVATVPNGPGGSNGNRATISWSAPPGGGTQPTGTGFDYLVAISGPVPSSLETFNTFTSTGELTAGLYTVTVRTRSSCGTGTAATTTFTIATTQPTGGGASIFTGAFNGSGTVTDGNRCTYQVTYQGTATMTLTPDITGLNWGGTLRLVGTYTPAQNLCFVSSGSYDNTGAVGNTSQGAGTLRSDSIVVGPGGARFDGNVPSGTSVIGTLSITPGGGTGTLTIPLTLTR